MDPTTTTVSTTTVFTYNESKCSVDKNGNVYPYVCRKNAKQLLRDPFGLTGFGGQFAGIPQNIVINLLIFGALLGVFVALRKRAWGSARIPLVGRFKNEWSSIFYGNRGSVAKRSTGLSGPHSSTVPGSEKLRPDRPASPASSPDSPRTEGDGYDVNMIKIDSPDGKGIHDALSFKSWVRNAWMANDEYLLERSGPAALEYLRFQRHVIIFATVLCVISIAIILPINYGGMEQEALESTFPKTTIGNLSYLDQKLWVHVAFTLILFPMALLVMYSYGLQFGLVHVTPSKLPKTLMIYGLKSRITTEEKIRQHFQEVYPDIVIKKINLTLDVKKLSALDYELAGVNDALYYYQTMDHPHPTELPIVRDVVCGYCLGSCIHGTDAIEFYQGKKAELEKKIHAEVQSWKKTNPVFFISLASEDMVARY